MLPIRNCRHASRRLDHKTQRTTGASLHFSTFNPILVGRSPACVNLISPIMHPRFARSVNLRAVAGIQARNSTRRVALTPVPRIARILQRSSNDVFSHQFSSTSTAFTAGGSKDVHSPVEPVAPPAEPWRCHFEFDDATPTVWTFFDKATSTWQYVVADTKKAEAVIIDPVLDYDPASGKVSTSTADGLLSFIRAKGLTITGIL